MNPWGLIWTNLDDVCSDCVRGDEKNDASYGDSPRSGDPNDEKNDVYLQKKKGHNCLIVGHLVGLFVLLYI